MLKALENVSVILENRIIWDGMIVMEDGIITAVGAKGSISIPEDAQHIDGCGAYVGPGFVDIHVHGGNGYNTWEEPEKTGAYFLRHGTTSFLATMSGSRTFDVFMDGIARLKDAMDKVKNLKGIFFEGPYFNTLYGANAHKNPWKGPIEREKYTAMVDLAGDAAVSWMIAPERPGVEEFMAYARKVNPNLIFTVGHSEATPEQIHALGKMRPKILTHAMNATGRINEVRGIRGSGPDEYCYTNPDMYAELISDSCAIHVTPTNQQLLLKIKGVERVILITDGTAYNNPAPAQYAHIDDLNFDDMGGLSGSRLTMDKACRNVMASTGCGIAQAFMMASTNPARAMGWEDIGSIEVGKRADLVLVDDKFNVKQVFLGGQLCQFA